MNKGNSLEEFLDEEYRRLCAQIFPKKIFIIPTAENYLAIFRMRIDDTPIELFQTRTNNTTVAHKMITQPDLFLDPKIQKRLSTLQSRPLEGKKAITDFLLAELGNQEGNSSRQAVIREILKTLEIKKKNIPLKNTILLFAVEQEIQGTYDFPKMVASLFAIKSLKHHLQECSYYLKRPINQQ